MISRPRLSQAFAAEIVEDRALFLLGESREFVFEGRIFAWLAPLLDGTRTVPELLVGIGGKASFQELYGALGRLAGRGCIVEADGVPLPADPAFWDSLKADSAQVVERLRERRVTAQTVGDIDVVRLEQALARAGVTVDEQGEGDVLVVATDDYLRPELAAINARALGDGRQWMLAKPVGMVPWVGPVFQPGDTGCWECLRQRLAANRHVQRYIEDRTPEPVRFDISRTRLVSAGDAGMNLAAIELAKSIGAGGPAALAGKVLTLDLPSMQLQEHTLVKRPQCPACGSEAGRERLAPGPIVLESSRRATGAGSDHRTVSADETFRRHEHHISPITGIVTALYTREQSDFGHTHNYTAGHYFPMLMDDVAQLRVNAMARSGGKGATIIQAKTSALCESIERYSGIRWGDEPTVTASYASLAPDAVHIRDLALYSEQQYRERATSEAGSGHGRDLVPSPLDDDAEIAWSQAWSLTRERLVHLPTAYCYYGHRDPDQFFCRGDSNGNAAGNSLEEAILQGFLELVERDSVALWWYNRARRPLVDAASFALPYWDEMLGYYRDQLQRDLHVLDLTADLGVAVFAVVSRRVDRAVEDIIVGFGAHLDPKTALLRALTEANQYLPALRISAPDGSTRYQFNDGPTIGWWRTATYENQPYLVPDARPPARRAQDFQQLASGDFKADVETCVRLAAARDLEMIALDQTRPDIDLPVVKVVVPGMRHFWRRLGPGRLYDVPVELGWLAEPRTEDDLNPVDCFV